MGKTIAIVSDFGLKDHYVGVVHGIIRRISPEVGVIDITHQIRAFDLLDGALKLKWSYKYFPTGTIFLCLVDPEPSAVPVIVSTEKYFLVCPNNGIGSLMFEEEPPQAVYRITAEHHFIPGKGNYRTVSQLTPIAAELSRLQSARHLGEEIELKELKRFRLPKPKELEPGVYEAVVIDVDRFGNLILNLQYKSKLPKAVEVNGFKVEKSSENFTGFNRGELFISVHPENHVQVVAYMASAAKLLKATRGTKVKVFF
jgi:S-adenosylmethionine hydrolase